MNNIRPFDGKTPQIGNKAFVASSAEVIGDVLIGKESSIWFQSVLRGDINSIRIGERTNLQDGTIVHVDFEKYSTHIGNEVTIGHRATIHGCKVQDRCLIGMSATVLSGAVVETGAIVAAGAIVRENQTVPARTLVAGVPAKPVREVTDAEWDTIINSARHYVDYARKYLDQKKHE
ncbi:MAG: gamma carbonic anhydrase family protein [Candidatus Marinimicrobia bacterium]|nr:gamma carbonic anhydrase family protein [Candidatus Neomarinimicrobiota bacterium]MCF7828883.1 gamma carbonic anhydrase family protein [Candidatus Neomarinimicrobiota bacterium]MCF7880801.1 gamma carbonic anhydrase family protein [Candidatus Neomarinimicrobiota bacterium]